MLFVRRQKGETKNYENKIHKQKECFYLQVVFQRLTKNRAKYLAEKQK